jgi:hypothetical protein
VLAAAWALLGGCGQHGATAPAVETGWETDFEACAELREEATRLPATLFLSVDSSGSMDDGEPVSRWDAATGAFTTFFGDPEAGDLGVALRMWPDLGGCDELSCDAAACGQPQVLVSDLGDPAHRQALIDALEARIPEGPTPLSAALAGAAGWARDRRAAFPGEQVAIAVVTDGEPNGCDEDIDAIASLAAQSAADGTLVFAVGIEGSNEAQIDQIAQQGGTGAGYFVGSGAVEAELLAALQDIRGQVLACTFALPEGGAIDDDRVRLEYLDGGQPVVVPRVAGPGACAVGGWYLEGGSITLCPSTCIQVQDLPEVTLEIAVGCECEVDSDCPELEVCARNLCVPCEGAACQSDVAGLGGSVQGGALLCGSAPGAVGWLALGALLAAAWRRSRP